jgi:hypothetical protein
VTTVDYQSDSTVGPVQIRRVKILLRMAQFCALAPMTIGVAIVVLYWICDYEWLLSAGLLMLALGLVFIVTGLALAIAWQFGKRSIFRRLQEKLRWRGFFLLLLVLAANIGVAFACMAGGMALAMRPQWTVQVTNKSGAVLDSVAVRAAFVNEVRSAVGDNDTISRSFHPAWKNEVVIRVEQAGTFKEVTVPITPDMKPRPVSITVRVGPGREMLTQVGEASTRD